MPQNNDDLMIGSFGQPAQNVDATGRMIRDSAPPAPARKPSILQGVDDEIIKDEIGSHEGGAVQHMYKDSSTIRSGGYVTVGYGHKTSSAEEAKQLLFNIKDKRTGQYRKATPQEIENAFNKVDAIRNDNNIAARSFDPRDGFLAKQHNLDDLQLPKEEARRLLDKDLREHARYVMNKLKKADIDPDTLPPSIKKVVLDIQFNNGLGENARRGLFAAIKNKDWVRARTEIQKFNTNKQRDIWRLQQIDEAVK